MTECGNYRGISLVAHEGKIHFKVLRDERTAAGGAVRVPPAPFHDGCYVYGPQATRFGKENARDDVPVFHRPAEGIYCVDHTLLWQVLAPFRVPPQMIEEVHQLHNRMRACVRNDDSQCLE